MEDIRSAVPKDTVDRLLLLTVIPTADAILAEVQALWTEDNIKDEALLRPFRTVQQLAEEVTDYRADLDLLIKRIKKKKFTRSVETKAS